MKYNNKATVCANRNCITVYGEAAKVINAIALTTAAVIAIALIAKALK